jgi:hypothetical protein
MFLHTAQAPSREEWGAVMDDFARHSKSGSFARFRVLAVTDGGGPDVTMRMGLQRLYEERQQSPKAAVVTANVVVRGIVAALNWFNPSVRMFAPQNFPDALAHIDVPATSLPRILREYTEMERELSPISCLVLINRALKNVTP